MARPSSRSGRSPAAPRWSAAAARATIRSLESLAPQHHLHSWVKMLELVLRSPSRGLAVVEAVDHEIRLSPPSPLC